MYLHGLYFIKPVLDSLLINSRLLKSWINWSSPPPHTTVVSGESVWKIISCQMIFQLVNNRSGCRRRQYIQLEEIRIAPGQLYNIELNSGKIAGTSGGSIWNGKKRLGKWNCITLSQNLLFMVSFCRHGDDITFRAVFFKMILRSGRSLWHCQKSKMLIKIRS